MPLLADVANVRVEQRRVELQLPIWLPGITSMLVLGLAALGLARLEERLVGHQLLEGLVLALLLGVVARNVVGSAIVASLKAGADLAAKQVLEVGVALLGASVFFAEILRAGPALLGLVVVGVGAGILTSYSIGRALGLSSTLAVLVAVGNSICGNSAIVAVAPVIRAERKDVASAIGLTAVIGVGLVLGLPLLIGPLGLGDYQYGVLAGMSVYAVPQVIAAAFPVSQLSGEVATLVKLTRVLLLGPVVLAIALLVARQPAAGVRLKTFVPWFVVVFLLLAGIRSVGLLPDAVASATLQVSRLLTILAMAGLGFGVDLASVTRVGPRVGMAVIASLAFMATFTAIAIRMLELGAGT